MAVFPNRIVLKNSGSSDAAIRAAIAQGGTDEINLGEIVIGYQNGVDNYVELYTLDGAGNVVTISGANNITILSENEPGTRPDGNTLKDGDFWFDTSLNQANSGVLSIWFGNLWRPVGGSGGGGGGNLGDLDDVDVGNPFTLAYKFEGGVQASGSYGCAGLADAITDNFSTGNVLIGKDALDVDGNLVNFSTLLGGIGNSGTVWWSKDGVNWVEWIYTVIATNRYGCTGLTEVTPLPSDWVNATTGVPAYISFTSPANSPIDDGAFIRYNSTDSEWQAVKINSTAIVAAVAPTVDVNGEALTEGSLWYDSSAGSFWVYESGAWQQTSGGGGSGHGRGDGGDLDTTTVDSPFIFGIYGGGDIDTTTEDKPVELVTYDIDGGDIV